MRFNQTRTGIEPKRKPLSLKAACSNGFALEDHSQCQESAPHRFGGKGVIVSSLVVAFGILLLAPVDVVLSAQGNARSVGPNPTRVVQRFTKSFQDEDQDDEADKQTPVESLAERQTRLAKQYKQLEEKLFQIYQIEQGQNPARSELIKSAYQLSQSQRVHEQLDGIATQISTEKLKTATQEQREAIAQLQKLLVLLQNEDEDARLKEEQDRVKAYLKEVERLLRGQRGLRGQAEGGVDLKQLADPQGRAAERAGDLAKKIEDDEKAANPNADDPNTTPSENEDEGSQDGSESQDDSKSPEGDPQSGDPAEGKSEQSPKSEGQQESGQPQEGGDSQNQPSEGQQSSPQEGQQSSGEQPSGQQQSPSQQEQEQEQSSNPVQQRIEAAKERMKDAQENLEQAKKNESIEEMKKAEAELAKAKEELEEILRQLREKEIERALADLETRIRKLRDEEKKVYESTVRLDEVDEAQRVGEFRIQSGKISSAQASLSNEADGLLLMLQDEGSSIAFPVALEQIRDDMEQVAQWLRDQKVGEMTQAIEQDVITSLDELIEALVAAQEERENGNSNQQQQGQPGQPGEEPLVNKIQELKLIRGLQVKINRRHDRYTGQLSDPEDPIGYTQDQELQDALDRLADRQLELQQITRDIVLGKNQ